MQAVLREFSSAVRQGSFPRVRSGRPYTRADALYPPVPLEPLGNGAFSVVYALNEAQVLKVALCGNDPYHHFASLPCRQSLVYRGIPPEHLPRIHAARRHGPVGLYVLERLWKGEWEAAPDADEGRLVRLPKLARSVLDEYADERGFMLDLGGNILWRAQNDGRWLEVISDPWCDKP